MYVMNGSTATAIRYRWAECTADGEISMDASGKLKSVAEGYTQSSDSPLVGSSIADDATETFDVTNTLITKTLTVEKQWKNDAS